MGMDAPQLALACVPCAILPLTAKRDQAGLQALAAAAGSTCAAMMQAHGHTVIAKRLFEGAAPHRQLAAGPAACGCMPSIL